MPLRSYLRKTLSGWGTFVEDPSVLQTCRRGAPPTAHNYRQGALYDLCAALVAQAVHLLGMPPWPLKDAANLVQSPAFLWGIPEGQRPKHEQDSVKQQIGSRLQPDNRLTLTQRACSEIQPSAVSGAPTAAPETSQTTQATPSASPNLGPMPGHPPIYVQIPLHIQFAQPTKPVNQVQYHN